MNPENEEKAYFNQIRVLSRLARSFVDSHQELNIKVQFNTPPGIFVIATATDALENKLITINDAGRQMLEAMGAFADGPGTPTLTMIRAAIEYMEEIRKEDENDPSKPGNRGN